MRVPVGERDLDQPHALLDQPPRHEARLAEGRRAVEGARRLALLGDVEGAHFLRVDESERAAIRLALVGDLGLGVSGREAPVLRLEQSLAVLEPEVVHARGQLEVLERVLDLLDQERREVGREVTRARGRLGSDRDAPRQPALGDSQLMRDEAAHVRVRDGRVDSITGVHEIASRVVIGVLGVERPHERERARLRQPREVLAQASRLDPRLDRLERAARLGPGLGVERVELARTALQEQEDHGVGGSFGGSFVLCKKRCPQTTAEGRRDRRSERELDEVAASRGTVRASRCVLHLFAPNNDVQRRGAEVAKEPQRTAWESFVPVFPLRLLGDLWPSAWNVVSWSRLVAVRSWVSD